jgi:hypothetical protein
MAAKMLSLSPDVGVAIDDMWGGDMFQMSDPYHEPKDTTRAVLHASPPLFMLDSTKDVCPWDMSTGGRHVGVSSKDRAVFESGDVPSRLPRDPLFQLPSTSLFVRAASTAQLGNDLKNFLLRELDAPDVKVRCTKFTLKAAVQYDGAHCTVKLRVHRLDCGLLVVEVQRRQGDAVAFMGVFEALSQHLAQRCELLEGPLAASLVVPLAGALVRFLAGSSIASALDTAERSFSRGVHPVCFA